jgi:hypothetical protein
MVPGTLTDSTIVSTSAKAFGDDLSRFGLLMRRVRLMPRAGRAAGEPRHHDHRSDAVVNVGSFDLELPACPHDVRFTSWADERLGMFVADLLSPGEVAVDLVAANDVFAFEITC